MDAPNTRLNAFRLGFRLLAASINPWSGLNRKIAPTIPRPNAPSWDLVSENSPIGIRPLRNSRDAVELVIYWPFGGIAHEATWRRTDRLWHDPVRRLGCLIASECIKQWEKKTP